MAQCDHAAPNLPWTDICDDDFEFSLFGAARQSESDGFSRTDLLDLVREIGKLLDLFAFDRCYDIPEAPVEKSTPRIPARSAGEPGAVRTTMTPSIPAGCNSLVGSDDPDTRRGHSALLDKLRDHAINDIDGNGKADPGI